MNHKEFKSPANDIKRAKNILKDSDSTIKTAPNNVEFASSLNDLPNIGGLKTKSLVEIGEKMLIDEYSKKRNKK